MAGNSIGKEFIVTFFGESHGKCVGVVVDGCPTGLPLTEEDIQPDLNKRLPPDPNVTSARREKDRVEIFSGTFNGLTTGAPIMALVRNEDVISKDYERIKDLLRPGHADYPARIKYDALNDYRGGGRFSGRLTVCYIIAGTIAKKILSTKSSEVMAHTIQIGDIAVQQVDHESIRKYRYENSVRCADPKFAEVMVKAIEQARHEGDSLGGIIEGLALNVPVGIGEPFFDSLDSDIAKIMFNIPAVKGVEIGGGFALARMRGSEANDPYALQDGKIVTTSNKAGGILGGMSTGMPIIVRVAFKPPSSIPREQKTVDIARMEESVIQVKGRHDPCVIPKAVPVVEAGLAITLADHMIRAGIIKKVLTR